MPLLYCHHKKWELAELSTVTRMKAKCPRNNDSILRKEKTFIPSPTQPELL
jgi:hypothetical protein